MNMQAALLTASKQFSLWNISPPKPASGEVLVRVNRAGICGSDMHFYLTGRIGDAQLQEPFLMGHEFSGVIEDENGIPSSPPKGTRVAVEPAVHCGECPFCKSGRPNICPHVRFTGFPPYPGAFAEYISIPVENVYPLPDTISDDMGPVLETLAVAIHAIELMPDPRGKNCAVIGSGSVGMLVALLLVKHGARIVMVVEPVAERRGKALEVGCLAACHPSEDDTIKAILQSHTDYGVELVYEAAGEPEAFQQAFEIARPGGSVCFIGIYPYGSFMIDFTHARRKELQSIFVRRSLPRNYPEAIRLVSEEGLEIQKVMTHSFPLQEIGTAFELACSRREGAIKTLLRIVE